jgi:hypothetical protein
MTEKLFPKDNMYSVRQNIRYFLLIDAAEGQESRMTLNLSERTENPLNSQSLALF